MLLVNTPANAVLQLCNPTLLFFCAVKTPIQIVLCVVACQSEQILVFVLQDADHHKCLDTIMVNFFFCCLIAHVYGYRAYVTSCACHKYVQTAVRYSFTSGNAICHLNESLPNACPLQAVLADRVCFCVLPCNAFPIPLEKSPVHTRLSRTSLCLQCTSGCHRLPFVCCAHQAVTTFPLSVVPFTWFAIGNL